MSTGLPARTSTHCQAGRHTHCLQQRCVSVTLFAVVLVSMLFSQHSTHETQQFRHGAGFDTSVHTPCLAFSAPYARTTMIECGTVTQYCKQAYQLSAVVHMSLAPAAPHAGGIPVVAGIVL
jgi:hypothetical protein